MKICLTGPIATQDVVHLLDAPCGWVPAGYTGAPLTAVLIEQLLALGHEVVGITVDYRMGLDRPRACLRGPGFTLHVLPGRPRAWRLNGSRPGRMLDFFAVERRLLGAVIAEEAPDIVHAHWTYEFALAALDQAAPHLITCHDSPRAVLRLTRSPYRALRQLMARQVFARGLEFSAVSDYLARELAPALGHRPQVIPNPVALRALALGRPRPIAATRRVAMVLNGWERIKNARPALRAFALWRSREPAAELELFGAGFGAGEAAQSWAVAEGLAAGMRFRGPLPHHELLDALAGTDVLLHPSLEESFGVVVAEAMALGLPVVAGRDSGAVPWVLGAGSPARVAAGLLTDVRSPAAIAQALASVFDAGYAARSAAGLERARSTFSPASVARAYEARYAAVARAAGTRPQPCRASSASEALP